MNMNLKLDTLNMITQKTQTEIEHIIRKSKSNSEKLRFVSLYLLQLKHDIYQWLSNLLVSSQQLKKVQNLIAKFKIQASEQLTRHRLHLLLKKKLNKIKKQSFLHSQSIDSQTFLKDDTTKITQLQKSLANIQKDLNIQEEDQQLSVSTIIQKSRMKLINQNELNSSIMSGYSLLEISALKNQHVSLEHNQQTISEITQFRVGRNSLYLEQQTQISQVIEMQNQNKPSKTEEQPKPISDDGTNSKTTGPKLMKKKKKSVYSNMGNGSRQGLLGNLLQESYFDCMLSDRQTLG